MRIDPANLPRSVGELRRIIMSQAADIAAEREARTARERELATAFLARDAAHFEAAVADLCHVTMNLNEFAYID